MVGAHLTGLDGSNDGELGQNDAPQPKMGASFSMIGVAALDVSSKPMLL